MFVTTPTPPLGADDRLLSVSDAAIFLGVSQRTVSNLSAKKEIPFVRIRRRVLFCPRALRDWIQVQSVQSVNS